MRFPVLVASLLFAGLSAASAATTVNGSYSLSYSPTVGNAPTLTPVLPQNFSEQLTLNVPTSATTFFDVSPAASCGKVNHINCSTASGTVTVNFNFSAPTSGAATATAAYVANYSSSSDSITWNKPDPLIVNFLDGSVLNITLLNDLNGLYSCDWLLFPKIQFTLVKGPVKVPETPTAALLLAGLIGLGYVSLRRRRAARAR
jgi:hypothetical protein